MVRLLEVRVLQNALAIDRKPAMSVQALAWVLEYSEAELGDRLVLIAIANHADARGDNAWPSVPTMASEARLSERNVQYALRHLEELGELEIQYRQGPAGTNRYRLKKMLQVPLFEPRP